MLVFLLVAGSVQARDLKVATWNLEWLTARVAGDPALPVDVTPKTAPDWAVLRQYATQLNADVVALQNENTALRETASRLIAEMTLLRNELKRYR